MTDLLTATQGAFFDALNVDDVTEHGKVLQHIPENAKPPMIIVGSVQATREDEVLERHTVDVVYFYEGEQRCKLFEMMHAGRTAIEQSDLEADGAVFGDAIWQQSTDDIADDGITYSGIQTFEVLVQPDE